MFKPFEAFIGLRYVRSKRRSHFISFISLSSVLGVTIGITVVITVMSVMNGLSQEMIARTLRMISHSTVSRVDESFSNWQTVAEQLRQHQGIAGAAPFFRSEAMLSSEIRSSGIIIQGILPDLETEVSDVRDMVFIGDYEQLQAGTYNILLGKELAQNLAIGIGDKVTMVITATNNTPLGNIPRTRRFTVAGIFEIGTPLDMTMALINLEDAKKLFRISEPEGLRIKTDSPMHSLTTVREAMEQVQGEYEIVDWSETNRELFHAYQIEKVGVFIILTLTVAVAVFNIVSMLVMVAVDKQADIAVLRTLGASPGSIMKIFIVQGTTIGLCGMILGDIFGVWLASEIDKIIKVIENISGAKLFPCDVYYICELPAELYWSDVFNISLVALVLCLVSTIYPAWRAASSQPAEALRYE